MSARAIEKTSPAYRAILEAYAGGVNAGLASLHDVPPEYLVLNATPQPWKPEDTILTILAMFNTLQGRQAAFEQSFGTLADTLPPPLYEFLAARGSEWDAPVTGGPTPEDHRHLRGAEPERSLPRRWKRGREIARGDLAAGRRTVVHR